jgi:hypothetical protein
MPVRSATYYGKTYLAEAVTPYTGIREVFGSNPCGLQTILTYFHTFPQSPSGISTILNKATKYFFYVLSNSLFTSNQTFNAVKF